MVTLVAVVSAAAGTVTTAAVTGPGPGRGAAPARAWLADCSEVPETVNCGAWSAYVVDGGNTLEVSATFQVPWVTCGTTGGEAFWVGVQGPSGDGYEGLVQPAVSVNCDDGQPDYYANTAYPNGGGELPLPLQEPVNPGDEVTLLAYSSDASGDWVQEIEDFGQDGSYWVQFIDVSGGPISDDFTAVAVESYGGGADFCGVNVTDATINGGPIGQASPYPTVQDPSIYQPAGAPLPPALVPSPLQSGQDFQFAWYPQPPGSASGGACPATRAVPASPPVSVVPVGPAIPAIPAILNS